MDFRDVENYIFWYEVGSAFGEPGGAPPLRIPRRTPGEILNLELGKEVRVRCLKFPSGRTSRGDYACHFKVVAVITINSDDLDFVIAMFCWLPSLNKKNCAHLVPQAAVG